MVAIIVPQVEWMETRGFRDPNFEPRCIRAIGGPNNWRFVGKDSSDIRWYHLPSSQFLQATANLAWLQAGGEGADTGGLQPKRPDQDSNGGGTTEKSDRCGLDVSLNRNFAEGETGSDDQQDSLEDGCVELFGGGLS